MMKITRMVNGTSDGVPCFCALLTTIFARPLDGSQGHLTVIDLLDRISDRSAQIASDVNVTIAGCCLRGMSQAPSRLPPCQLRQRYALSAGGDLAVARSPSPYCDSSW